MKILCKRPSSIHQVSSLKNLESSVLTEGHSIARYVFSQPDEKFKYRLQPRLFSDDLDIKTGVISAALGRVEVSFATDVIVMGKNGLIKEVGDHFEAYMHPFYKVELCEKVATVERGVVSVYQGMRLKDSNFKPIARDACLTVIYPLAVERIIEEPVLLLTTPVDENYSHYVWDTLPQLWYLMQLNNPAIKILVDDNLPKYKLEFLDALGFDASRRISRRPDEQLLCKSVYMGTRLGVNNRLILPQGLEVLTMLRESAEGKSTVLSPIYGLLDRITEQKEAPAKPLKLLFLDRNDDRKNIRRLLNEEDLWDICKKYGFERITPGRMSLAEKRRVYAEADVMVGQYGGGLQNHFLCQPGTRLLVLQSNLFQRNIFDFTSDMMDMPVLSLFGRAFPSAYGRLPNNSNFMVDEQQFEKALQLLLSADYRKQIDALLKKKVQLL